MLVDLELLQSYMNLALTWIGFGTVVGLATKAIMPGRDPGGSMASVLMGIVGTMFGLTILLFFYRGQLITPVSLKGFWVGLAGAIAFLSFYKVLGGYWFAKEANSPWNPQGKRRRRREYSSLLDE